MLLGNCFLDSNKSNDSAEHPCFRDKCDFLSKFIKIESCVKIKRNYYHLRQSSFKFIDKELPQKASNKLA